MFFFKSRIFKPCKKVNKSSQISTAPKMFQEDIENIQSQVYHHLYPFIRRSEKRHIRLQISNDFFLHLRNNLKVTGRFKDANHLIETYCIPTVLEIEPERASGLAIFQARISKGKLNGRFNSKPWITIRFIRINIFKN